MLLLFPSCEWSMMIMMEMVDLKVKLRLPRFPEQGLAEGFNWTKDKHLA